MTSECYKLEKIILEVKAVRNNCPAGLNVGYCISVDSMVPEGICPFLYHSIIPYLEGLENGAIFNSPGKNFMIVQCPNPVAGIEVKIYLQKEKQATVIEIYGKKADCPYYHYEKGGRWLVSSQDKLFCRKAYDSIFPYLNALSSEIRTCGPSNKLLTVTCPSCPDFVVFQEKRL